MLSYYDRLIKTIRINKAYKFMIAYKFILLFGYDWHASVINKAYVNDGVRLLILCILP